MEESSIDEFVKDLSRGAGLTARLLHDIYDGQHDGAMEYIAGQNMTISVTLGSNEKTLALFKSKVEELSRLIEA